MRPIRFEEFDELFHELRALTRTRLPLPEGLQQLAHDANSPVVAELARHLAKELDRGRTISEALATAPVQVSPAMVVLLEGAERSDALPAMIDFALEHARRMQRHQSNMLTALAYPLAVCGIAFLIIALVANLVLPQFQMIFRELGAELPWLTQLVMDAGHSLRGPGLLIPVGLLVAVVVVFVHPDLRGRLALVLSQMPGLMILAQAGDTALGMRFASILLKRGEPLGRAMDAAAVVVTEPHIARAFRQMSQAATRGGTTADAMPSFSGTASQLYRQGERNGDLSTACEEIAEYCERRYDRLSRRAVVLLEPLAIVIIGVILGMIVVSLYLPMFMLPKLVAP